MSANQQPDDRRSASDQNNRDLTHTEVEELLPAFVLGALEPAEMLAVEQYLATHPALQAQVAQYEATLAELACAAPPVQPPTRAKAALLKRAQQEVAERQPQRVPFLRPTSAAAPVRPSARKPVPQPEQASNWFGIFIRTFALAGAVAAIAILTLLTVQLRNNVVQLTNQLNTVQGQLTQIQTENSRLVQQNLSMQQLLQNQQLQVAILSNPQQHIALVGTEGESQAAGGFYTHDNTAVLVLRGLQPLSADQTYQLWWITPTSKTALPGELLTVSNRDNTLLTLAIPAQYHNFSGIGISIEPAGGSATPTKVLLLGQANKIST
jgi:anti-sigma-K factor RskA